MGQTAFFQYDLLSGLGGLLFSPTRGLFVFSPFLLFLVLAWRHLPRERGLTLALSLGVILQILLYAKTDWRGGASWGPRYMTDLLPLLMWMLARSHRRPVVTGEEDMIGSRARIVDWHGQEGRVHVRGEIWRARGPAGLVPDQKVRVQAIDGLTVEVAPEKEIAT